MGKVKLVEASVMELKPDKNYLIMVDNAAITMDDAVQLQEELATMGIHSISVVLRGNPKEAVKIIEAGGVPST